MRRCTLVAAAVLLSLAPWALTQPPPERAAAPDKQTQARTEALIRKLFAADYEDAKKGGEAARNLASNLLREARATKDDAALRFSALTAARDLAAEAGDAITVLQAIDDLTKHYTVKGLPMKRAALARAAAKATGKEANEAVVEAALAALDDALGEDDYDSAKVLIDAAETAGVRVKSLALYGRIDKRAREVEAARTAFGALKTYAERLARDPNDAEANLHLGKHTCLVKGNWERGIPMLLKSGDDAWKKLAERELAAPKQPKEQVDLGDEHNRMAEGEQGQAKRNLHRRALFWYEQALPKLEGLTKLRIAREVRDLNKQFPSLLARAEITGELFKIENSHVGGVQIVAISPDGKQVLSGGFQDKTVKLWDARTSKSLKQFTGHTGNLQCVAVSPDGKLGASGCTNFQLRTWDLEKGGMARQFVGHNDYVRGVVFLPDKKTLLSAGDDKTLRLWDLGTGNEQKRMTGHNNFINSLAIDKDGKRAATASVDMTVRVWDLGKAAEIKQLKHDREVLVAAISPDGKLVVSSGQDKTVRIWDVDAGKELRRLKNPSQVWTLAFSPDGKQILTGGGHPPDGKGFPGKDGPPPGAAPDNYLRIWDVETGKEVRKLAGHGQLIRMVAYSADGRFAVSCSNDHTIRIWGQK